MHDQTLLHFAARHFLFTTRKATDAGETAKLFEPQLTSAGWERIAFTASGNVSSSSWHYGEKMGGGLHLAFTVLQLDPKGVYLGTMTAVPYWIHASPEQAP